MSLSHHQGINAQSPLPSAHHGEWSLPGRLRGSKILYKPHPNLPGSSRGQDRDHGPPRHRPYSRGPGLRQAPARPPPFTPLPRTLASHGGHRGGVALLLPAPLRPPRRVLVLVGGVPRRRLPPPRAGERSVPLVSGPGCGVVIFIFLGCAQRCVLGTAEQLRVVEAGKQMGGADPWAAAWTPKSPAQEARLAALPQEARDSRLKIFSGTANRPLAQVGFLSRRSLSPVTEKKIKKVPFLSDL